MKTVLKNIRTGRDEINNDFHLGSTIVLILLFLTFIGSGFYLYITN